MVSKKILFASIAATSFVLHLVWEYLQCRPFFIHGALPPTNSAMLIATAGDVLLTTLAYLAVAASSRSMSWPLRAWGTNQWITLELVALTLALATEWMGLSMGRWTYSALAPRLPGTNLSLLPILQLVILFPTTFVIARWFARRVDGRFQMTL